MPYVNVTLDIGAAINAYWLTWSYRKLFSNVLIHPGDFHFMKENFQVLYIFCWLIYYLNSINVMITGINYAGSIFEEITESLIRFF